MSVNTATSSLLPNLPGYRTKEFKTGSKKQFFTLVGGQVFLRDQYNNPVKEEYVGDEGSLSTIGSPVKKTFHHDKQGLVLTFQAYFEESPDGGNTSQIRKCMVLFYLEDNTLKIVEKPSLNSGVTQGTLVRRAIINKPDGTPYNESDFYIGDYVIVYGRQYRYVFSLLLLI